MHVQFIDPGRFRTPLSIEYPSRSADGAGGQIDDWSEAATSFGLVEPVSTGIRFAGEQSLEDVTHRVTIRARTDVSAGMRFRHNNRVLLIMSVHDPDESGRYLVCRCSEEQQ